MAAATIITEVANEVSADGKGFYSKIDAHIQTLAPKMRGKWVITKTMCKDIMNVLKQGKTVVMLESFYHILHETHEQTGHGGRDKVRYEISQHYSWIPSKAIDIFLSGCVACQVRKPVKNHVVPKAIISLGFMTRVQIDLIDLRTRPDKQFNWILHCRDHFSKYSWAFALPTKEAHYVLEKLQQLFYQFGPCRILQSDNGREFTAQIIKDLMKTWTGLTIVNGRPRHPQSQGLVERGNATLCNILGKFMHHHGTTYWTECLLPVVYSMNTSLSRAVNTTPFEIVFGQKPRTDCVFWKTVSEQGITDETDLPSDALDVSTGDDGNDYVDINDSDSGNIPSIIQNLDLEYAPSYDEEIAAACSAVNAAIAAADTV
ncbi:unnamed protein product [Didymodactylos carnosus]|uniref:Integrase catalytic domain-containing protein n=2 Tax=Didymodactylos carnosus TaxID=1234261 RepID=A0A814SLR7_9BILA|nr:unnamed protein product [Didymodactylos carnosus]CAF3913635.1 unnamed protein product [Didymodactylos carnosus]